MSPFSPSAGVDLPPRLLANVENPANGHLNLKVMSYKRSRDQPDISDKSFVLTREQDGQGFIVAAARRGRLSRRGLRLLPHARCQVEEEQQRSSGSAAERQTAREDLGPLGRDRGERQMRGRIPRFRLEERSNTSKKRGFCEASFSVGLL